MTTQFEDKRVNHQVREVFAQACAMLAPYVAANDKVKTMSSFAMTHMIHDTFPSLTSEEVYLVIATVEKAHLDERIHAVLAALNNNKY